jgi:magnesium chelatase family protein
MIYCRYAQWKSWNSLPDIIDEKLAAWQHGSGPVGLAIAFHRTGVDGFSETPTASLAGGRQNRGTSEPEITTSQQKIDTAVSSSGRRRDDDLLRRSHTLHGAVLIGLDGLMIELQARAMEVLEDDEDASWRTAVGITGMAKGSVREALDRISGAFQAAGIPAPRVKVLVNLTPPSVPKDGTWLDLPLAIIMLQAAGELPDLPGQSESDFVLDGFRESCRWPIWPALDKN